MGYLTLICAVLLSTTEAGLAVLCALAICTSLQHCALAARNHDPHITSISIRRC